MFKERISLFCVFIHALQMRQHPRIKPKQLLTENEAKTYVFNNIYIKIIIIIIIGQWVIYRICRYVAY